MYTSLKGRKRVCKKGKNGKKRNVHQFVVENIVQKSSSKQEIV